MPVMPGPWVKLRQPCMDICKPRNVDVNYVWGDELAELGALLIKLMGEEKYAPSTIGNARSMLIELDDLNRQRNNVRSSEQRVKTNDILASETWVAKAELKGDGPRQQRRRAGQMHGMQGLSTAGGAASGGGFNGAGLLGGPGSGLWPGGQPPAPGTLPWEPGASSLDAAALTQQQVWLSPNSKQKAAAAAAADAFAAACQQHVSGACPVPELPPQRQLLLWQRQQRQLRRSRQWPSRQLLRQVYYVGTSVAPVFFVLDAKYRALQKTWYPSQFKQRMCDIRNLEKWCITKTSELRGCSKLEAAEFWADKQAKRGNPALKTLWSDFVSKLAFKADVFAAYVSKSRPPEFVSPAKAAVRPVRRTRTIINVADLGMVVDLAGISKVKVYCSWRFGLHRQEAAAAGTAAAAEAVAAEAEAAERAESGGVGAAAGVEGAAAGSQGGGGVRADGKVVTQSQARFAQFKLAYDALTEDEQAAWDNARDDMVAQYKEYLKPV
ncbi:hypothetical protein HXX76_016176 [Chlamydomonas incerta]|uniref:Uncharacterized protein n=1 Tax=Chlamydomonas incerta TaxID=51695 RepID=A0A835VQY2_CHLIN|nr:hypothetical protein HXX76_016176 [Chlamydomonas incerta]|eukprot:KAG2422249.1 hypothetical protein HXX76_016176 [Chlamydomonas incerta]